MTLGRSQGRHHQAEDAAAAAKNNHFFPALSSSARVSNATPNAVVKRPRSNESSLKRGSKRLRTEPARKQVGDASFGPAGDSLNAQEQRRWPLHLANAATFPSYQQSWGTSESACALRNAQILGEQHPPMSDGVRNPSPCDDCYVPQDCSPDCGVSCDGSDECSVPNACDDPDCERDVCFAENCANVECTDQSCRANQCRVEPCVLETCFDASWSHISFQDFGYHVTNPTDCETDHYFRSSLDVSEDYGHFSPQHAEFQPGSCPAGPSPFSSQGGHARLSTPHVCTSICPSLLMQQRHHDTASSTLCNFPPSQNNMNNVYGTDSGSLLHPVFAHPGLPSRGFNPALIPSASYQQAFNPNASHENHLMHLHIPSRENQAQLPLPPFVYGPDSGQSAQPPGTELAVRTARRQQQPCSHTAHTSSTPTQVVTRESPIIKNEGEPVATYTLPESNVYICKWASGDSSSFASSGICLSQFSSEKELWHHVKSEHTSQVSEDFRCQWSGCERKDAFATRSKLERHMIPHTGYKEHECPDCDAAFSLKQQLDNHIRIHTGDTPFKCQHCDQYFKTAQARDDHQRRHGGVRAFKCRICGIACTDASNRSKHEKIHREEVYRCLHEGCTAKAKRWDNIKRHFESSGHCTELLTDRKAQKRYKQDAEGIAKADAAKVGQHAGHTSAAPAQDDQD